MMEETVVDASNALLGRISSYVAKQALLGKKVVVVNCSKVVISGNTHFILESYRIRRARGGSSMRGPNFPKSPERIVKRAVRGMLPYRQQRGLTAFKNVTCYNEIPEKYSSFKMIKPTKEKSIKSASLSLISQRL